MNPALADLGFLVGEWGTELSNAAFLPDRTSTVTGRTDIRWIDDGAFLRMAQVGSPAGPPQALWLIGRDAAEDDYTVIYFDSRPESRVYRMGFDGTTLRIWRQAPGFWQRYAGRVAEDRGTITAAWEKSTDDGVTWQHDFDITYRRR